MRKRILLLTLIVLIFVVASCHGRKFVSNFEMPESFDESRNYELTFWAKNDSNPTQRAVLEKAIADFEEIYPNISIEIGHYSSYPDLYKAVLQNIGTNTTPNVAVAYPDHVAAYLQNPSLVIRLNELMNHPEYGLGGTKIKFASPTSGDLIEQYVNEGLVRADGASYLYTLPFMRSTECLYVNKTWLDNHNISMPLNNIFTWDQVWDICRIAEKEDPDMIPLIYQSSDNMFIELAYQYGNDYTTVNGDILFDNYENKKMIQNLNRIFKEGLFEMKATTGIYPGDRFNLGRTIFGIDSSAGSTWMGPESPLGAEGLEKFEVVTTTIPQVNVDDPLVISQGPSLCVFNKEDPQVVLASWIFLQFLLTNDVQIGFAKTEGYSPVTTTAINSKEFQDFLVSPDTYYVQRDAILNVINFKNNTFTTPAFNGSASVRDAVGKIINKAASNARLDINEIFKKAMADCR